VSRQGGPVPISDGCGHHCGVSMGTVGHCKDCHRVRLSGAAGCDE